MLWGQASLCALMINRTKVAGTVGKLVDMKRIEKSLTSFNWMFLLVHVYFVAGTVCKSSTHDAALKLGSYCPHFMMHRFKPTEFHATCCWHNKFFAKMVMSHKENFHCNMYPFHVPTKCPVVCAGLNTLYNVQPYLLNNIPSIWW